MSRSEPPSCSSCMSQLFTAPVNSPGNWGARTPILPPRCFSPASLLPTTFEGVQLTGKLFRIYHLFSNNNSHNRLSWLHLNVRTICNEVTRRSVLIFELLIRLPWGQSCFQEWLADAAAPSEFLVSRRLCAASVFRRQCDCTKGRGLPFPSAGERLVGKEGAKRQHLPWSNISLALDIYVIPVWFFVILLTTLNTRTHTHMHYCLAAHFKGYIMWLRWLLFSFFLRFSYFRRLHLFAYQHQFFQNMTCPSDMQIQEYFHFR